MKKVISILALAMCAGCASFNTDQVDRRTKETFPDGTIKETTEIRTQATARTAGDGNSTLEHWQATQTEKSQSAAVGGLSQTVSSTNAVQILNALKGVMESAK